MNYFKEIDAWLSGLLAPLSEPDREQAKKEIKAKILESYRNGQNAPKEAKGAKPDATRTHRRGR